MSVDAHTGTQLTGSIQVSGDGPTLPSLRPKAWVGAGLGLGSGLREGRVGPSPENWIDPDRWWGMGGGEAYHTGHNFFPCLKKKQRPLKGSKMHKRAESNTNRECLSKRIVATPHPSPTSTTHTQSQSPPALPHIPTQPNHFSFVSKYCVLLSKKANYTVICVRWYPGQRLKNKLLFTVK